MIKTKFLVVATALTLAAACVQDPEMDAVKQTEQSAESKLVNSSEGAVNGELLLYVDDATAQAWTTAAEATRCGNSALDQVASELGAESIEPLFNMSINAEKKIARGMHRWFIVKFDKQMNIESAATKYAEMSQISRVQFNTTINRPEVTAVPAHEVAMTRAAGGSFNDPMLYKQWHYINDATVAFQNAKAGEDIGAEGAWKYTTGNPEVIVAVVDEGVKYSHPDLVANMWVNPNEIADNGKDDDDNGYVDDIYGINAVTNTAEISWAKAGDTGHGTHVAGTVAAVNNNGIGVCGVAGGTGKGDGVRIISCQIISDGEAAGPGPTAKAIEYAADRGACVLQNSWGFGSGQIANDQAFKSGTTSVELTAIDYFKAKQNHPALEGGIVIFAAGNDGQPVAVYPGAYNNLISVTAVSPDGLPTYYTCYDRGCNVAATGGQYTPGNWDVAGCVLSTIPKGYGYMQGTSMACPHVSGIAALAISYAMDNGITLTLPELKDIIVSSVHSLDPYLTGFKTNPEGGTLNLSSYKGKMGTGLIDAYQVLMAVRGTKCIPVPVGETVYLEISDYIGDGKSTIKLIKDGTTMSDEAKETLGVDSFMIMGNKVVLTCTKPGTAPIKFSYVAGGSTVGGGQITGGMATEQEFMLVAREGIAINEGTNAPITPGGWL